MPSNLQIAQNALKKALHELQRGKKEAAQAWAQRASELAPELEETRLLLAALSEPHASLEHLNEALKINAGNQGPSQGLDEVRQQPEETNKLQPEHAKQPFHPGHWEKHIPALLRWLRLVLVYALAITAIMLLAFLFTQSKIVDAQGVATEDPNLIILQSIATSTGSQVHPATLAVPGMPAPTDPAAPTPAEAADQVFVMTETPIPTQANTPNPAGPALPADPAGAGTAPMPSATPSLSPADTAEGIYSAALPPTAEPAGEKRILVNVGEQHLYAYQGDTLVYGFVISTGADQSTKIGTFPIVDKIPQAFSEPWGFWMPDWLGIYPVGEMENGLHALPVLPDGTELWGDAIGTPISHGCVVLKPEDARRLYEWAEIGTVVEILP